MDISLYIIIFLLGIISFFLSWSKLENKEFLILIALVSWILLIISSLMAFNIQRTEYDQASSAFKTISTVEYEYVLISALFAVIQTLNVFVQVMEYYKTQRTRRGRGI